MDLEYQYPPRMGWADKIQELEAEIDRYDKVCTDIRNELTAVGIPELTDDRLSVIPLVDRVKKLIYLYQNNL